MWGEIAGAGIGAVSGLAQGLMQKKAQKRQFEYNEKAADNAQERSIKTMGLLREWNSPAAKKQQLQEAGLNPALVYSGGAAGAGGGAQAATGAQGAGVEMTQPVAGMALQSGIAAAQTMADVKLKEAQAENLNADTEKKKGADTELTYAQIADTLAAAGNKKAQMQLTEMQTATEKARAEVAGATTDIEIQKASEALRLMTQQTVLTQEQATEKGIDNQTRDQINKLAITNAEKEGNLLIEKALLTNKQAGLTEDQAKKIASEILNTEWAQGFGERQLEEVIRNNGVVEAQGWTRNAMEAIFGGVKAVGGAKQMMQSGPVK